MQIYIDSEYKCHISNDGTRRAIETEAFNGKCEEYVEGYRFVPAGEVWTREDGEVFHGEMITPWRDYAELVLCQSIYDRLLAQQAGMLAEMEQLKAQNDALVNDMAQLVEEVYQSDLEMMTE